MPKALSNRWAVSLSYRLMVTNGNEPEPALLQRLAELRSPDHLGYPAGDHRDRPGQPRRASSDRLVEYDGPVVAVWGDS